MAVASSTMAWPKAQLRQLSMPRSAGLQTLSNISSGMFSGRSSASAKWMRASGWNFLIDSVNNRTLGM